MDWFFCITLSVIVFRMWWKHSFPKVTRTSVLKPLDTSKVTDLETVKKRKLEIQRDKDAAELKKQGYSDELITTILPVINDGQ